jgi:hypothetical protein
MRPASQTRHAALVPLLSSDALFRRPFPIPLQFVGPQVLACPRLDEWHEELARHVAQALQCTIRTGGFPCIEMIRGRPVRSQQVRHFRPVLPFDLHAQHSLALHGKAPHSQRWATALYSATASTVLCEGAGQSDGRYSYRTRHPSSLRELFCGLGCQRLHHRDVLHQLPRYAMPLL